jgi:hypothetical protein
MRFRTISALLLVAMGAAAPLHAQSGLRAKISQLFIFGPGAEPLFLSGSADPNNSAAIQIHGTHFQPSSAADNASVISFVGYAIGGTVANLPVGSTSGGETFRFENGVPVKTSVSAGPIFGERATTLGRGRTTIGLNQSAFHLATLRGVDLNNINLVFTHENVTGPACDAIEAQSCAAFGVPLHENDVIDVRMSLDIDVHVSSFYMTYGVTDRLDFGVVVPVVSTNLRGDSFAQILPFGGGTVQHFFSGTPQQPVLDATRVVHGSAAGLGDVSARMKANLRRSDRTSVALLVDARFPTGSADDLLGAGTFAGRGLMVLSSQLGGVSPHANVGFLYRAGTRQNDAVLGTLGLDTQLATGVTLAADLLSEMEVGSSKLALPQQVVYSSPFRRTVNPTDIPETRDDIINGSFGFKLVPRTGVTGILNALFPLNRGGLRPGVTYTAGAEFNF